jgi:hypothetical protein
MLTPYAPKYLESVSNLDLPFAKTSGHCPSCGSSLRERDEFRGLIERVFFRALFLYPIKCVNCHKRFWDYTSVPEGGLAHDKVK